MLIIDQDPCNEVGDQPVTLGESLDLWRSIASRNHPEEPGTRRHPDDASLVLSNRVDAGLTFGVGIETKMLEDVVSGVNYFFRPSDNYFCRSWPSVCGPPS